jgi:hypothetical protein
MKNNRRDFLKLASLIGIGLSSINMIPVRGKQSGMQLAPVFDPEVD